MSICVFEVPLPLVKLFVDNKATCTCSLNLLQYGVTFNFLCDQLLLEACSHLFLIHTGFPARFILNWLLIIIVR